MATEAAVAALQHAEVAMQRVVEERDEAHATIASMDAELQSALSKLCEQRTRLNQLEEEKQQLLGHVDELLDRLVGATAQLRMAQDDADQAPALRAAVSAAQQELASMAAEVDSLHVQLHESRLQLTNIAHTVEAVLALDDASGDDDDGRVGGENVGAPGVDDKETRIMQTLQQVWWGGGGGGWG